VSPVPLQYSSQLRASCSVPSPMLKMMKGSMFAARHHAMNLSQCVNTGPHSVWKTYALIRPKQIALLPAPRQLGPAPPLVLGTHAVHPMVRAHVVPARPAHHRHSELVAQHEHDCAPALGGHEFFGCLDERIGSRRIGTNEFERWCRVTRCVRKGGGCRGQDATLDTAAEVLEETGEQPIRDGADGRGWEDVDRRRVKHRASWERMEGMF
jgi:hypothetical protein